MNWIASSQVLLDKSRHNFTPSPRDALMTGYCFRRPGPGAQLRVGRETFCESGLDTRLTDPSTEAGR
jgi:hypothetical protein